MFLPTFTFQTTNTTRTKDTSYIEKELMQKVAAGDEQAFAAFFHHYIGVLKPFIFSFTKSDAIADEIIQDIFIRIWLARNKLAEVEAPRAWLFKVASNECFHYLRKKMTNERTLKQFATLQEDAANPTLDHINVQEIKNILAEAVNGLASQRKRIYEMSRDKGMKIEEIAAALQLSPNTVKNVLVTTTKIIRAKLEESGYYLPVFLIFLWIK